MTMFERVKDYQDYTERLRQIPIQIDQSIELMKKGIEENVLLPKEPLGAVLKQIEDILKESLQDINFFQPFKKIVDNIEDNLKQQIVEEGKTAVELVVKSFQKLANFILEYIQTFARKTHSVSLLPNGKEYYELILAFHTTSSLSAQNIHR